MVNKLHQFIKAKMYTGLKLSGEQEPLKRMLENFLKLKVET